MAFRRPARIKRHCGGWIADADRRTTVPEISILAHVFAVWAVGVRMERVMSGRDIPKEVRGVTYLIEVIGILPLAVGIVFIGGAPFWAPDRTGLGLVVSARNNETYASAVRIGVHEKSSGHPVE
jgi:hypothetical protein